MAIVAPDSFEASELSQALQRWERYRKEKRLSPWTPSTIESKRKSWGKYPVATIVAAIDQSIDQGWQGIFPEKIQPNGKPSPNPFDRKDQLMGGAA